MDLTGCEKLYGEPLKIAQSIMDNIKNELGLWCSIGISENKFLSKMASEMKKPLGITEVWQKDIIEKIWPLPVRSMYGIRKQTENKLLQLAIYTIGDIAKSDINLLMKVFGKYGSELHSLANGVDTSKVEPNPKVDNKSISRSTTLSEDIRDLDSAETILLLLSEEVGEEARKIGCKGSTITVTIKYNDFSSITRQKTIKPTYLTTDIYNAGISLLKQNWHNREIRLLGIGLSNFMDNYIEQMTFIDEHSYKNAVKKEENLEKALDIIRNKYGKDKIKRAKLMEEKIKKRT
jgi:DNA polymerase-4